MISGSVRFLAARPGAYEFPEPPHFRLGSLSARRDDRLPISGASAEKLVDVADRGGNRDAISGLFKSGASWLVVTTTAVYRVQ